MRSLHRYAVLLMVWTLLGIGSAAGASSTIVTMPSTYKIYLLVDPRSHAPYYVGQTRRPLYDRMDEHFFEQAETLVAKKNRAMQGWFLRRYEEAFGRRETALREEPQGRGGRTGRRPKRDATARPGRA